MRISRFLAAILVVLSIVPAAFADSPDTITLKNGDHLTGTVSAIDGQQVTLATDAAGDVKIKWSSIQGLTTQKAFYVATPDKKTVTGTLTYDGTNLIVHASTGDVTLPLTATMVVRSTDQQQAYEKSLHPRFIDNWAGGLNIGLALARGNSDTTTFNTAFTGDRKTLTDEIKLSVSSIYATSGTSTSGAPGGVTADEILAGAAYNKNITKKVFLFASGAFTHDALEDLNLQGIYSGGVGWHVINTPKTTLDFNLGMNYTRASYSSGASATMAAVSVDRNFPGVTAGQAFMHKFGDSTVFTETFTIYPTLTQIDQYSFALNTSVVTKIKKWLGWQTTLTDNYVANPPIAGTVPNDVVLSTGFNLSFTH
jgi:putative salt-induced outer membrane protein YdiY